MTEDWSLDIELLERWRSNDQEAGKQLFARHSDAVVRFFRNKASHDAQDLIQDTFLRLVKARDRIQDGRTFRAYLLGIARRVLYEHLRGLKRARNIDPASDSIAQLNPGPSTVLAQRAEQRLLMEGLRRLPVEQQTLLELYYWEELNSREIAEVMQISPSGVRTRIQRARDRLCKIIRELETNAQLVQSTVSMIDDWAQSIDVDD